MVLQVRGLSKTYGQIQALAGVDLAVEPGQVLGLLGPNGAGKTTLVSIVAGLRRADRGTVTVGGIDMLRHPERARPMIGIAPQEVGIYPTLTVKDNLGFFAELAGYSGRGCREAVAEAAGAVGLEDRLDARAATLSGGQKRRLHSAMALMGRPRLLLLDEPTAGADVETRAQLLDLVGARAGEGAAVVYSTHYLPEIERLGADVTIIDGGRIRAEGTLAELVASYGSTRLDLTLREAPPAHLVDRLGAEVLGRALSIVTDEPERTAAEVLSELAGQVVNLTIVRPSLESVYLSVVGHSAEPTEEVPA
jgi:ABC-2 type transport system ATP-binding protein